MSNKRRYLRPEELQKYANNFGSDSDSDIDPYATDDDQDIYEPSSSSTYSDASDSTPNITKRRVIAPATATSSKIKTTGMRATFEKQEMVKQRSSMTAPTKIRIISNQVIRRKQTCNPADPPTVNSAQEQTPPTQPQTIPDPVGRRPVAAIQTHYKEDWGPVVGNYKPVPQFAVESGVVPNIAALLANGEPGDFYDYVVDGKIIKMICEETNNYATQCLLATDAPPQSRLHVWEPTTKAEIRHFLALVSWMGLVRLPSLADYWSRDEMFGQTFPRTVMSRNRFELLLRMIHFSDNSVADPQDKLNKIRPLIEQLNHNFKILYVPDELVCIDETLLPFRGRLGLKQYIKNKRHKYGVKIFKLCSGHGYTYTFKVYAGKELNGEVVSGENVILQLIQEGILHEGRTLITDNWYTGLPIATKLLNANTHYIGTIRKNRVGLPKDVVDAKLKKGEIVARENGDGITIINWKDQRNVIMLSTRHGDEMVEVQTNQTTKSKPKVVMDYNLGKSSVDLSDQLGAYSNPLRKSMKWYRKVGFELLLTTSVVNAYILYKQVTQDTMSITDFKKAVIKHLTTANDEDKILKADVAVQTTRKVPYRHEMKEKTGKKHSVRRMCKNCYKKNNELYGRNHATNKTKKVITYCNLCPGEPFLCLNCFNDLHK